MSEYALELGIIIGFFAGIAVIVNGFINSVGDVKLTKQNKLSQREQDKYLQQSFSVLLKHRK